MQATTRRFAALPARLPTLSASLSQRLVHQRGFVNGQSYRQIGTQTKGKHGSIYYPCPPSLLNGRDGYEQQQQQQQQQQQEHCQRELFTDTDGNVASLPVEPRVAINFDHLRQLRDIVENKIPAEREEIALKHEEELKKVKVQTLVRLTKTYEDLISDVESVLKKLEADSRPAPAHVVAGVSAAASGGGVSAGAVTSSSAEQAAASSTDDTTPPAGDVKKEVTKKEEASAEGTSLSQGEPTAELGGDLSRGKEDTRHSIAFEVLDDYTITNPEIVKKLQRLAAELQANTTRARATKKPCYGRSPEQDGDDTGSSGGQRVYSGMGGGGNDTTLVFLLFCLSPFLYYAYFGDHEWFSTLRDRMGDAAEETKLRVSMALSLLVYGEKVLTNEQRWNQARFAMIEKWEMNGGSIPTEDQDLVDLVHAYLDKTKFFAKLVEESRAKWKAEHEGDVKRAVNEAENKLGAEWEAYHKKTLKEEKAKLAAKWKAYHEKTLKEEIAKMAAQWKVCCAERQKERDAMWVSEFRGILESTLNEARADWEAEKKKQDQQKEALYKKKAAQDMAQAEKKAARTIEELKAQHEAAKQEYVNQCQKSGNDWPWLNTVASVTVGMGLSVLFGLFQDSY